MKGLDGGAIDDGVILIEGDRIKAIGKRGEVTIPAEVTDDMMPGTVSIPHGWGHDLPGMAMQVARARAGVNANALTESGALDPLSGTAALSGVQVEVARAAA